MVGTGETITVQVDQANEEAFELVRRLPNVRRATYAEGHLKVACASGAHNLVDVLEALRDAGVAYGRVYAEPPTLNDVFLEITGKQLRDPSAE